MGYSQDLTNIKNNKPFIFSGGLNASGIFYGVDGMKNRRDPFSWNLNGNINLNIYGIVDLPFSFNFSKQNTTYNQPSFQQYGISPKYKFITVHAGYRSMQFSSYSLSGVTFLGGGIEIMPENYWLKGKAVYGRFVKAIPWGDTLNPVITLPAYERWGYGTMFTIGKMDRNIDLVMFRATDRISSTYIPDSTGVAPAENLVIGFNTKQKIGKRIVFDLEYTISAYTRDTRMAEKRFETYTYANNLGDLFTPRYSSYFSNAIVAKTTYQGDGFSVGTSYKRIEPDYQSMGAIYLTNDIADYLFNASKNLFKNKVSLSGSIGYQHNNVGKLWSNKLPGENAGKEMATTNQRVISSLNGTYNISKKWNLSFNYSNFSATTEPTQIILQDSIKYAQITRNLGGSVNYNTGSDKIKHGITLTTNYQTANTLDKSATYISEYGTDMLNSVLGYSMNIVPKNMGINASLNYTDYLQDTVKTITSGPVFGLVNNFLKKKLRTIVSYSLLKSFSNSTLTSNINVVRAGVTYRVNKHHSFRMNNSVMFKYLSKPGQENKRVTEFKGTVFYAYSF